MTTGQKSPDQRYRVVASSAILHSWWYVVDTHNQNESQVQVRSSLKNAKKIAEQMCEILNLQWLFGDAHDQGMDWVRKQAQEGE